MNEQIKKGDSVFFIGLDKIEVNPYQPRIEFDQEKLQALSDSIKQYGVIQPIVVTRKEEYNEETGITTKYQIIAGERRFRASKMAGLNNIPAIIREKEDTDAEKLELAIIENLQREDLNPVDKAKAFKKLADEFGLKHVEIAKKMGKSREYVSNAMRILMLPDNMLGGLTAGKISEGHTRSLLMLKDRREEQEELYKRIVADKLTVRAAEKLARSIATDKIRKKVDIDPEIKNIENHIREKLGTKVSIDQKPIGDGGKLTIEYFNKEDLRKILAVIESDEKTQGDISNNFGVEKEEVVEKFDDIQPTVFREEIEKIEQFGNVKTDAILQNEIKEEVVEKNEPVEEIQEKMVEEKTGFRGFSIGKDLFPKKEEVVEKNEPVEEIQKPIAQEEVKNEIKNFQEKEIQDFKDEELDRVEENLNEIIQKTNLGNIAEVDNFSDNGGFKELNFDEVSEEKEGEKEILTETKEVPAFSNENKISENNSIKSEINDELEKISIDNFDVKKDLSLDYDYGQDIEVEGLEKIKIRNDFDRERINSFAKTDEILGSFGGAKVSGENFSNEIKDIDLEKELEVPTTTETTNSFSKENFKNKIENSYEQNNSLGNNFVNDGLEEEKEIVLGEKDDRKNEYSDLYSQFLESKNEVAGISKKVEEKISEPIESITGNDFSLNSADNIEIETSEPDISRNMISDENNVFQEGKKVGEVKAEIIAGDNDGFMALANMKKEEGDKGEDLYSESIEEDEDDKKSKYSFKGFSL